MKKSRASQIRDALLLINDILRDNDLEIDEHAGGLCIYDKKDKKVYSEPQKLPTENLTANQTYFAEQLQDECVTCRTKSSHVSYRVDPYMSEMFGDNNEYLICDNCEQAARESI